MDNRNWQRKTFYEGGLKKITENRNLTIIEFRPTAVFGPGNRGNVYNLMRQISRRRFVMIGTGDYVKSLAYVSSLADFICRQVSMQNGYKLYNFVDHPQLRMVEVVEIIHKALGLKFNHVRLRLANCLRLLLTLCLS